MGNGDHGGQAAAMAQIERNLEKIRRGAVNRRPATVPLDLKLYCINLARSPARRAYMAQQADRLGLRLTFVDAIDGRRLDLAATAEYRSAERCARFGWDLEPTEVAAGLSHRKALLAIRAAGHKRAVVLEDDVTLLPDFAAAVSALHRRHDPDFDIIRLFGARNRAGRLVTLLNRDHAIERPYGR